MEKPADPRTIRFRPINVGRWFVWATAASVLLIAPLVFSSSFAWTLLSQMGIMVIFALSFNMLLGQGGMLSFGHAVYSGVGAFVAIHALNRIGAGTLVWPVTLLPLLAAGGAALCGVVLGFLTTRRAGTPFAMITLGLGELVFAGALMFPALSGGEGGVSGNRTVGGPLFGIDAWTLGSQLQVYYVIAAWCFASLVAIYALTHTPLGRIANAVRDNPERAEFIGYNPQRVRWLMLVLSSFFAGIAGGLSAINFEIVSAENLSAARSGGVLLAAFIGGTAFFFGPILGAVIFTFFAVALSDYTKAWQLYLGVFFVLLVAFAPGGLASLLAMNLRVVRFRKFAKLRDPYVGVLLSAFALAAALVLLIELVYHVTLDVGQGPVVRVAGLPFDTSTSGPWILAVAAAVGTAVAFEHYRRVFSTSWARVQTEIESVSGSGTT
jgi:branched-chain amino acid transport system permease protein